MEFMGGRLEARTESKGIGDVVELREKTVLTLCSHSKLQLIVTTLSVATDAFLTFTNCCDTTPAGFG